MRQCYLTLLDLVDFTRPHRCALASLDLNCLTVALWLYVFYWVQQVIKPWSGVSRSITKQLMPFYFPFVELSSQRLHSRCKTQLLPHRSQVPHAFSSYGLIHLHRGSAFGRLAFAVSPVLHAACSNSVAMN